MITSAIKLVNKAYRNSYPQEFNKYTTEFYFDRTLIHAYRIMSDDDNSKGNIITANNLTLQTYIGNIINDFNAFMAYMTLTSRILNPNISTQTWIEIMEANAGNGKGGIEYLKLNLDILTTDVTLKFLLDIAVKCGDCRCIKYLLNVVDNYDISKAVDFNSKHMENIEYVKLISNHLSSNDIINLDIDKITAKHRIKDVRKFLLNTKAVAVKSICC